MRSAIEEYEQRTFAPNEDPRIVVLVASVTDNRSARDAFTRREQQRSIEDDASFRDMRRLMHQTSCVL